MTERPRGLLLDLDGTVWEDETPLPGAAEAIAALREGGLPVRFVTNITRVPAATIAEWLRRGGIPADPGDVFTPPRVAVAWLRGRNLRRVELCLPPASFAEFEDFEVATRDPQAVVVGDLGSAWSYETMNGVFRRLLEGAELVALHRNRYWKSGGELVLDVGAFVAAFEYATGREATVVGKPSRAMFETAARSMDLGPTDVAMVGDDLRADIGGAQAIGIRGFMVRTGKFRADEVEASEIAPERVIESVAALPDLLLG